MLGALLLTVSAGVALHGTNVCDAYVTGKAPQQKVHAIRMTDRWVADELTLGWACPLAAGAGKATSLDITVKDSPSDTVTVDLSRRGMWGSTQGVQLYLWPMDEVKRACKTAGTTALASHEVELKLHCAKIKTLKSTLKVDLTVHCAPDGDPSPPALPGERHVDEIDTCVGAPPTVLLNEPLELPFCSFSPKLIVPRPESVRLVQLDGAGKVIGAQPPCYRDPQTQQDAWNVDCATTLKLTPTTLEPLRFAYEATFTDGTIARTKASTIPITTPEQEARKLMDRDGAARRWAQEHTQDPWQRFARADQGYALDFPQGWEHRRLNQTETESYTLMDRPPSDVVDPSCGGVRFVSADIDVSVVPAEGTSLGAWVQTTASHSRQTLVRPLDFEVGGEKAFMIDFGNTMAFRTVVVLHDDYAYSFHLLAQGLPAAEALGDLERMLRSVRFTGPQ